MWQRTGSLQRSWPIPLSAKQWQQKVRLYSTSKPLISITNANFYRDYPSPENSADLNRALFRKVNFTLPATEANSPDSQYWSVISPSSQSRTTFLQILGAQHICVPATARSYPYLTDLSTSPSHAIKYVGFDADRGSSVGGTHVRGSYLSARYESRREETDYSVHDYLTGHTELNALESEITDDDQRIFEEVVDQLKLRKLLQMPVANLSNGQTRRARIAKALMSSPQLLLLDGPFMGLDPNTLNAMASVLEGLAKAQNPRLIMSLRPEDGIPEWVSHLVVAGEKSTVLAQGSKDDPKVRAAISAGRLGKRLGVVPQLSKDGFPPDSPALPAGEAVVEMCGVRVSYGANTVLGDWCQEVAGEQRDGLWWSLHRGQRCGIFGANGSGKTTMLSLITSDHPQTYSLPIRLFGRSRLPESGKPGISVFDIQKRMGHSSPEVHAFFPKQLTVRRALESAWADAPLAKARLTAEADEMVNAVLRWFVRELNPDASASSALDEIHTTLEDTLSTIRSSVGAYKDSTGQTKKELAKRASVEKACKDALRAAHEKYVDLIDESDLEWAEDVRFRDLSFSSQRLLLFLRAIVATPDLVILDEALSGVDEKVRDKALLFLAHGEKVKEIRDGVLTESIVAKLNRVTFRGLTQEQALLVISHTKEDVPGCLREWICLPEPGEGRAPRTGTLGGPLELHPQGWHQIWSREQ